MLHASLLVALSGVLYGFMGYLGTAIIANNMSITTMLFWRFAVASAWMLLFVLYKQKSQPLFATHKATLLAMFMLGATGYAGSSAFFFIASSYIGTGLAMVVFFSYPIIIAAAGWLLHKKALSLFTMLMLLVMTTGLILLRDSSHDAFSILGILFGLASALGYGFYVVASKRFSSTITNSNAITMMVCLGSASLFLLWACLDNSFTVPSSLKSWAYLLVLGILATAIPIQLMLVGLKYISSMRAAIISVLEPLVTLAVGLVLMGETITHTQIVGVMLLLGSTIFVQFQREL